MSFSRSIADRLTCIDILSLVQQSFNTGDYVNAILSKQRAETISSVLYPDDRTYQVSFATFRTSLGSVLDSLLNS